MSKTLAMPKALVFAALVASCFLCDRASSAVDQLGELKVQDFHLAPSFEVREPGRTGFSLNHSYVSLGWSMDRLVSAKLGIGSLSLIRQPSRYSFNDKNLGFFEAYGQIESPFGQFRAGLIPLAFGYEGAMEESKFKFPYSLLYEDRILGRRDYGLSYFVMNGDFLSQFAVHNGEGREDSDGRLWASGRWSWKGSAGSEIGLSAMTGRYLLSTQTQDTKVRVGNIFAGVDLYGIALVAELTAGEEVDHSGASKKFISWHGDLAHPLSDNVGLQIRYDFLEPSDQAAGDEKKEISTGFFVMSEYGNSVLYILGIKRIEESVELPNDGVLLVWRLTPWAGRN